MCGTGRTDSPPPRRGARRGTSGGGGAARQPAGSLATAGLLAFGAVATVAACGSGGGGCGGGGSGGGGGGGGVWADMRRRWPALSAIPLIKAHLAAGGGGGWWEAIASPAAAVWAGHGATVGAAGPPPPHPSAAGAVPPVKEELRARRDVCLPGGGPPWSSAAGPRVAPSTTREDPWKPPAVLGSAGPHAAGRADGGARLWGARAAATAAATPGSSLPSPRPDVPFGSGTGGSSKGGGGSGSGSPWAAAAGLGLGLGIGIGAPTAVCLAAQEDAPAPSPAILTLDSGVATSAAPYKSGRGEDAWFIEADAAGVFDGVGGWASQGVDAGEYSRSLASGTARGVVAKGPTAVVAALTEAVEGASMLGSSTAAVVGLDGSSHLLVGCNLGDSGVRVIRAGEVVYRSTEQQYSFNFPAQVSAADKDALRVAEPVSFEVKEGDWVLLATDGLLDNMWEVDLLKLIHLAGEDASPGALAEAVHKQAVHLSQLPSYNSPFAWGAMVAGVSYPTKGKPDDVTVLFCRVKRRAGLATLAE